MKKNKPDHKSFFSLIGVVVLIILGTSIFLLHTKSNNTSRDNNLSQELSPTQKEDPFYLYLTPTVTNSNKVGWYQFTHPGGHFNFEYPNNWNVTVKQHRRSEDWYDILLADKNDENNFRIHFMTGGRGGPNYDYEQIIDKTINDREIRWQVMYRDDKAFEAVISFPNNDFGDKLIGLYIYLPDDNLEEFMKTVEDVIATMDN